MKTVNCIPRGGPDRAAGKVVDLAAWKAEHLTGPEAGRTSAPGRYGGRGRARRRRRPAVLDWAELAATLAVTAALLALVARVVL